MGFALGWYPLFVFMLLALAANACRPQALVDPITPSSWRVSGPSAALFRNPIVGSGADPWVLFHAGTYYYCYSDGKSSLYVSQSKNLHDIGRVPATRIWKAPPGREDSKQLWAPELHFIGGLWYIYYAASDGHNDNHRMFVLESTSSDPLGPYQFKGKIAAATDRWAIDGTVLHTAEGARYFVWSGWDAGENIQQNLYIAPMLNPWTLSAPDPLSLPLEAEQARVQGAKIRRAADASKGFAVGKLEGPETFIEFSFDWPQSGSFQLDIRYTNSSRDTGTHELSVNDGRQSLSYPATGWANFQTVQAFIPLVAGTNRLRFSPAQGRVDVDKIEIKKIGSDRVVLSMPDQDYDRRGGPAFVNEGPQILRRNGKIHIIYSGSASWSDDYNLVQLSFRGGDILKRDSWEKVGPVFTPTADVFAPGHASFTQSPDGKEDWIIYHAAKHKGSGWDRDVRAQTFSWDANDNPILGQPLPLVTELPLPSGTVAH